MPDALPPPIAAYLAANARLDLDAMLAPFASDAFVRDNDDVYRGRNEIQTLFEKAVLPVRAVFTPDAARHEDGRWVLEGLAHGDFKGSPIRFAYRFTVENAAIQVLEITA